MTPSKIKDDSVEDWSAIPSKVVHRRRFPLKEGSAEGRWKDPPKEEVCFGNKDEGGKEEDARQVITIPRRNNASTS